MAEPRPRKITDWPKLLDALGLAADDEFPFVQVAPPSVDPLTGGPGGNDTTITAELLAAALLRLGEGALHDLLGYLAFWSPTGVQDVKHVLRGDQTWGKAGGLGAGLVFNLPGQVIPVATTSSPHIPVLADGEIENVMVSVNVPPPAGMQLVVDVFVTGTSLFPGTKPTLNAGQTLGHFAVSPAVEVTAFVDVFAAAVITPAGRDLTIVAG